MSLMDALIGERTIALNRYQLDIPSCPSPLDVESFSGTEMLSQLYHYSISFTSADKDIDVAHMLIKPASLTMGGGILRSLAQSRRVHGVITAFSRISSSADQAAYQITLEPYLSLLDKQFRSHRFFVIRLVLTPASWGTTRTNNTINRLPVACQLHARAIPSVGG